MSRKKEYVLLVILGAIFLAAGGYLFQVWEDYHEASAWYQELRKFIIILGGKNGHKIFGCCTYTDSDF